MDFKKIRFLRGNMTQEVLAQRSGVDKAIISKIETGKMPGTVACHRKIAEVFGLKLSEFYGLLEEEKKILVEFHPAGAKTDTYQGFLEILTTIPLTKKMLPTYITVNSGEEKFLEETVKNVERFLLLIEGEIEVKIEDGVYQLKKDSVEKKGDSLYSRSAKRHKLKNIGQSVACVLCVSSPPVL